MSIAAHFPHLHALLELKEVLLDPPGICGSLPSPVCNFSGYPLHEAVHVPSKGTRPLHDLSCLVSPSPVTTLEQSLPRLHAGAALAQSTCWGTYLNNGQELIQRDGAQLDLHGVQDHADAVSRQRVPQLRPQPLCQGSGFRVQGVTLTHTHTHTHTRVRARIQTPMHTAG